MRVVSVKTGMMVEVVEVKGKLFAGKVLSNPSAKYKKGDVIDDLVVNMFEPLVRGMGDLTGLTNSLGLVIASRDSKFYAENGDGFSACIPSVEVALQLGFKFKYISSLEVSNAEYSILEALRTIDNVEVSQDKDNTTIQVGEITLRTKDLSDYGLKPQSSIKDILEVVEKV